MIKKFYLIGFLLIGQISVFSSDKEQVEAYFVELKNLNYKSAYKLAKFVEDEQLELELKQLSNILLNAGQAQLHKPDSINTKDKITKVISHLSHGYYSLYKNPYSDLAFKNFNEAYILSNETTLKESIKFSLLSIFEVYSFEVSQSNEDILQYLNRYKSLMDDDADIFHYKMNILLFNLRDIFFKIRIDQSFFSEYDDLMNSFSRAHHFWPKFLSTKAVFLETAGEYEKAQQLHQQAIDEIGQEPFLKYIQFRSYIRLSEIARNQNKYDSALVYIDKASQYKDLSDLKRADYYINWYKSKNLLGMKDFENAFNHLNKANELKTELDYHQNSLAISNLNRRYQLQEKEIQILKANERIRKTQYWLIGAFFALVSITIIYFLIQKNTRRKQLLAEKEKDIQKQKLATALKEHELATIDAMISGQEQERQKIANDLHDDLGSLMATIKLHFSSLKSKTDKPNDTPYDTTASLIDEAYNKIRDIAHSKNSGVIAKDGLLKSVEQMATKVSIANQLEIQVFHHDLDNRLENSLELNLFRIIQELITNIIKHSKATEAEIHLTNHGDTLNIMVEDNGIGMKTSNDTFDSGIGLSSIDKRVAFLHGTFNIESEKNRGTTVIINIPL